MSAAMKLDAERAAFIQVGLDFAGTTATAAAIIPIPNTTPRLFVAIGERDQLKQLLGIAPPKPEASAATVELAKHTQQAGKRLPEKIQVCIGNDEKWLDFPLARREEALAAGWQVKDFYSLAAPISEDTGKPAAADAVGLPGWAGDDSDALIHLGANFTDTAGVLRPQEGYSPTPKDLAAIDYLCNEWDYGYEPTLAVAILHPDGQSCRCPHCNKLNLDVDIFGDPVSKVFMCIRCAKEFRIENADDSISKDTP